MRPPTKPPMPDPSRADLHDTLLFHVARAYRTLRSALAHDLVRYGLHEGRDLVLIEIARRGGSARPREIQEALAMAPSSLSTILRRSEEKGYTTREPDPADGRTYRAGLTSMGRILGNLMADAWRIHDRRVAESLAPGERAALLRSLETVERALTRIAREEAAEAALIRYEESRAPTRT